MTWDRDYDLWKHVNEEINKCSWPMSCPHPPCHRVSLQDELALQYHLVDVHHLPATRPGRSPAPEPAAPSASNIRAGEHLADGKCDCRSTASPSQLDVIEYVPSGLRPPFRRSPHEARFEEPLMRLSTRKDAVCTSHIPNEITTVTPTMASPEAVQRAKDQDDDLIWCGLRAASPEKRLESTTAGARGLQSDRSLWSPGDDNLEEEAVFDMFVNFPPDSPSPIDHSVTSTDKGETDTYDVKSTTTQPVLAHVHGDQRPQSNMPRIRLHVSPPKITLRLNVAEPHCSRRKRTTQAETKGRYKKRRRLR